MTTHLQTKYQRPLLIAGIFACAIIYSWPAMARSQCNDTFQRCMRWAKTYDFDHQAAVNDCVDGLIACLPSEPPVPQRTAPRRRKLNNENTDPRGGNTPDQSTE